MPKNEPHHGKRGPGRPRLGDKRISITISLEDETTLKNFGFGFVAAGVRRAAALLRKRRIGT